MGERIRISDSLPFIDGVTGSENNERTWIEKEGQVSIRNFFYCIQPRDSKLITPRTPEVQRQEEHKHLFNEDFYRIQLLAKCGTYFFMGKLGQ